MNEVISHNKINNKKNHSDVFLTNDKDILYFWLFDKFPTWAFIHYNIVVLKSNLTLLSKGDYDNEKSFIKELLNEPIIKLCKLEKEITASKLLKECILHIKNNFDMYIKSSDNKYLELMKNKLDSAFELIVSKLETLSFI